MRTIIVSCDRCGRVYAKIPKPDPTLRLNVGSFVTLVDRNETEPHPRVGMELCGPCDDALRDFLDMKDVDGG